MSDFTMKRTWGPAPRYPKVLAAPKASSDGLMVVAGPCSIESAAQIQTIATELQRQGIEWMRGGVFRAGTYPPPGYNGEYPMQWQLCHDWARITAPMGIKLVVEVIDLRLIEPIDQFADAFQVGARQMQNYGLLRALSGTNKPVILKRNMGATFDEFLGAAEYLLSHPRYTPKVILCERGGVTNMGHVRWDLSISTIAAVKRTTGLPVLVDASHGTGRRDLVEPMTLAGVAAGADGFIVEVHPDPEKSLSDADQALPLDNLEGLVRRAKRVRTATNPDWVQDLRVDQNSQPPCEDGRCVREP